MRLPWKSAEQPSSEPEVVPDWKNPKFEESDALESPLDEARRLIRQLKKKAKENKRRSQIFSSILIVSTAAIPVCLLLSTKYQEFWLGKVTPTILTALIGAVGTTLAMIKPQERWRMHGRYQRKLVSECLAYQHKLGIYRRYDRDTKFLEKMTEIRSDLLAEWADLLPESKALANLGKPGEEGGKAT